jgi:penicillin-insensitive murein endopeptidase
MVSNDQDRPALTAALALALSIHACATPQAQVQPATAPPTAAAGAETSPTEAAAGNDLDASRGSPGSSDYATEPQESIDDDAPPDETYAATGRALPHPLAAFDDAALDKLLTENPAALGSMSLGRPNSGALYNGVLLVAEEYFALADASHAWGTQETVEFLRDAARSVWQQFPDSPKLYIGHISARNGGPLRPHKSHQCGRDVDAGFFYVDGARWYARATRENLDLPRTWAFVRALIANTDVEMILIDHSIQALLREYGLSIGEDPDWVAGVFNGIAGQAPAIIRHASGHATHMHIRFFNPVAQQSARRMYPLLVAHHLVRQGTEYVLHRVKPGETLGMLSRKYGVSIQAIRAANGLRNNLIRAKVSYKIPQSTRHISAMPPPFLPPRRPPPPRAVAARTK